MVVWEKKQRVLFRRKLSLQANLSDQCQLLHPSGKRVPTRNQKASQSYLNRLQHLIDVEGFHFSRVKNNTPRALVSLHCE